MLARKIETKLKKWIENKNDYKALLIYGARQVGNNVKLEIM